MYSQFYNFTRGETFRFNGVGFTFFNPPKKQFAEVSWQIDELIFAVSDKGKLVALSHLATVQLSRNPAEKIVEQINTSKWKTSLIFDLY